MDEILLIAVLAFFVGLTPTAAAFGMQPREGRRKRLLLAGAAQAVVAAALFTTSLSLGAAADACEGLSCLGDSISNSLASSATDLSAYSLLAAAACSFVGALLPAAFPGRRA